MQSDAHRDFKKSRSETYPMEKHQLYTEVGDLKSIFSCKKKKGMFLALMTMEKI